MFWRCAEKNKNPTLRMWGTTITATTTTTTTNTTTATTTTTTTKILSEDAHHTSARSRRISHSRIGGRLGTLVDIIIVLI